MDSLATQLIAGAVGGAIVSSIIGPFFIRYQDRRNVKANVLRALLDVEVSRWASKQNNYKKYTADVHQLRAAALIARAYRPLVEFYVSTSAIARSGSDDDLEANSKSEFAGSIDADVADFTSEVAEALTDYLWHPYTSRLSVTSRLQELKTKRDKLKRKYTHRKKSSRIYDWDR